jgi:Fic family protein
LPFYCGNGIISRLLTSYALADEYSFYTAVVFSKGAFSHSKAYSKIFDCAISKRNAGEMNIFVDEFLRFLYSGQMETIALLYEKLDRLESAKEIIKKDAAVDSDFKKKAMSIFAEDYVFGYNFGLERGYIMDLCENFAFVTQMKRGLEELEKAGKIIKIKGRPIVYRVSKNYFKDI